MRRIREMSLLLITLDENWQAVVKKAWGKVGIVRVEADLEHALRQIRYRLRHRIPYALIVVDVWAVPDTVAGIKAIHQVQPNAKIIVAAAGPMWKSAREAFNAGAIDYIAKSLEAGELETVFRQATQNPREPGNPGPGKGMIS
jgi:DNA-binding NtrC family response regulator